MQNYGARSRLARIALEKMKNDERLDRIDRNQWYVIPNLDAQLAHLFSKFLKLTEDQETKEFLDNCYAKSEWFMTQLFHSMMLTMLKWLMSTTSINGLLQRGSMFVFSMQQFGQLIDFESKFEGSKLNNLLDLGAGDGAVTSKMAPYFNNIYVTEMSYTMQWRLEQKGFKLVNVEEWDKVSSPATGEILKYDAISCLNLLDRCDKPVALLKQIKQSLAKDGLLIIALVLPFKPYVEYNSNNMPSEYLFEKFDETYQHDNLFASNSSSSNHQHDRQSSFCSNKECVSKMNKINQQIDFLVNHIFNSLGFELVKFTKLPYLCEGNLSQSFYYLFDYVFVFRSV